MNSHSAKGLLGIPLVRRMFEDDRVAIVRRAIDKDWKYTKFVSSDCVGFNPYRRQLYIAENSAVASWIDGGMKNERSFNESDNLVREVLFLAHDYLHVCAVMFIQNEVPELGFGFSAISNDNFEDYVFCQLLTESFATVGLDYWYLSAIDLNEVTQLGTSVDVMTVSYKEKDLAEFRRFDPSLRVQHPSFFEKLSQFYCDGTWSGMSIDDIRSSPLLLRWLNHELGYGVKQREYTRAWLAYLSRGSVVSVGDAGAEGRAVRATRPWQRALIKSLGAYLWSLVKEDKPERVRVRQRRVWSRGNTSSPDFRFTNVRAFSGISSLSPRFWRSDDHQFHYAACQLLGSYRYSSVPREALSLIAYAFEKKDMQSMMFLLDQVGATQLSFDKRIDPVDVFVLA